MAIIIGNSICPICKKEITEMSNKVFIPPISNNPKEIFYKLGGAFLHVECLNKHELKEKILIYSEKAEQTSYKCIVDGKLIEDKRKLINMGMLCSDDNEILSSFNHTILNEDNVQFWDKKDLFIEVAESYLKQNKWGILPYYDYNFLEDMINRIKRLS